MSIWRRGVQIIFIILTALFALFSAIDLVKDDYPDLKLLLLHLVLMLICFVITVQLEKSKDSKK